MLLADELRSVLVVGSSEGVVSQLALAAGATRVDHVDIDTECVRRCAELLPYGYTPAELAAAEAGEGPVRMHYADGWQFLADAAARGDRWDVVIVDLPDEPVEVTDPAQHARLYGARIPAPLRRRPHPRRGGVLAGGLSDPVAQRHAAADDQPLRRRVRDGAALLLRRARVGLPQRPRRTPVDDPVALAISRLDRFPALTSIDADALRRGAILPFAIRASRRACPDA